MTDTVGDLFPAASCAAFYSKSASNSWYCFAPEWILFDLFLSLFLIAVLLAAIVLPIVALVILTQFKKTDFTNSKLASIESKRRSPRIRYRHERRPEARPEPPPAQPIQNLNPNLDHHHRRHPHLNHRSFTQRRSTRIDHRPSLGGLGRNRADPLRDRFLSEVCV